MQKAVLIGRGYWGKILYPYIQKHYILCDMCGSNITKEALKHLLNKVDSAFIATPLNTHYSLAMLALECNCNVFLEKPSSSTQNEFKRLQNLAIRQNKILFTDYIYTFSESIRFGMALLKNDTNNIESIHAKITQYGNFYNNESVLEVIGVHYFSVFAYMQDMGIFQELCVKSCKFLDSKKQSALVTFCALRNNISFNITLECSLISQVKKRILDIKTKNYNLCIDMSSRTPLALQANNKLYENEMPIFDETNNIDLALKYFKQMSRDISHYKFHLKLCQTVLDLLEQAHTKAI